MIFASAYSKNSKEYTFQEFQNSPIEQSKVYKDFGASCGNETIIAKGVNDDMRLSNKALLK
jgi:hypothetical protein